LRIGLDMVAWCNSSHFGGGDGRITVQDQSSRKLAKPYLKKKSKLTGTAQMVEYFSSKC
jgi:hypothetical protein